jgi:hypothetical protein
MEGVSIPAFARLECLDALRVEYIHIRRDAGIKRSEPTFASRRVHIKAFAEQNPELKTPWRAGISVTDPTPVGLEQKSFGT